MSALNITNPSDAIPLSPIVSPLEKAFRAAYQRHYGSPLREFCDLGNGHYIINGIKITERELLTMLKTIEAELAKQKISMVKRLIKFLGGKVES
jgi:hypothetical protein